MSFLQIKNPDYRGFGGDGGIVRNTAYGLRTSPERLLNSRKKWLSLHAVFNILIGYLLRLCRASLDLFSGSLNTKTHLLRDASLCWRRRRDSNPRDVTAKRFSSPDS